MPPKKAAVAAEKSTNGCILRCGRENKAVEWREEMYNITTGLYGSTGMFSHLNRSYKFPVIQLRDYHPAHADPVADEDDDASGNDTDGSDADTVQGEDDEPAVAPEVFTDQFINKLKEGAYERRQKAIELQGVNETKIWALMWAKMFPASQSKVREYPRFETAREALNSVKLWKLIRKSHLTHMYGDHDNMSSVNLYDQQMRYNELRQGDHEPIADFKTRVDNQLKANSGVGMTEISESLRALDFIGKLDTERYADMLTVMRNNAAQNLAGAYPNILAGAFRTASTWTRNGTQSPLGNSIHSAYLADAVHVTKTKDPEKAKTPPVKKVLEERKEPKLKKRRHSIVSCAMSVEIWDTVHVTASREVTKHYWQQQQT